MTNYSAIKVLTLALSSLLLLSCSSINLKKSSSDFSKSNQDYYDYHSGYKAARWMCYKTKSLDIDAECKLQCDKSLKAAEGCNKGSTDTMEVIEGLAEENGISKTRSDLSRLACSNNFTKAVWPYNEKAVELCFRELSPCPSKTSPLIVPEPRYPRHTREITSAEVTVKFIVNELGEAHSPIAIEYIPRFGISALYAAEKLQYLPRKDRCIGQFTFTFELDAE